MIKENQRLLNSALVFSDIICLFVAAAGAYATEFSLFGETVFLIGDDKIHLYSMFVSIPVYVGLFYIGGLYEAKRSARFIKEFVSIFYCSLIGMVIVLFAIYFFGNALYPRSYLLIFTMYYIAVISLLRYVLRRFLRKFRVRGYNLKYLLLLGSGPLAVKFIHAAKNNPQYGYRFTGCLTDRGSFDDKIDHMQIIGKLDDIWTTLESTRLDEVVLALGLDEYCKIPELIAACEKSGIKANIVPAYYESIPSNPRMDEFDGIPVMVLRKIPLSNIFNWATKRLFDIVVSIFCIVLFSWIMLFSWIFIRITTKGPAIYKQERIGYKMRAFTMYKFCTMKPNDNGSIMWTQKKDDRRTSFGVFIRRFSIDELPQFFNVLMGSMSIVGPRPEIGDFVEKFKESIPRYMVRHQVKPGITGWAQIHNLRGNTSIEDRIKSDIYYIENWSLFLDIRIILVTMFRAFYNPNE